jgi:hypothetical protein
LLSHYADRPRDGLDDGELTDASHNGGISKDRRSRHGWGDLFKEFQPFRAQVIFEHHEASGIAAWFGQASDKSGADWIRNGHEHDWHGTGGFEYGWKARTASCQDDVRRERDQFRRIFAGDRRIASRPPGLDTHVVTF